MEGQASSPLRGGGDVRPDRPGGHLGRRRVCRSPHGPILPGRHRLEFRLVRGDAVVGPRGLQHGGGPGPIPLQRRFHRVIHRVEDLALAAEFDLLLGGVDIHVHRVELGGQMEDAARKLAHHPLVGIGLFQCGHHGPGLYIAAVDEKVLISSRPPAAIGSGDKAGHRHLLAGAGHRKKAQGHIPAQDRVDRALELAVAGGEKLLLSVPEETDAHLRVGEGLPLHGGKGRRPLGRVLFHELEPGGRVVKEVPHHHGGSLGAAGLLPGEDRAPFQLQGDAHALLRRAGEQVYPGHRRDGGQGLPPETQGTDGLQIVLGADFAGGVAQKRGLRLPGGDAAAVVGDPNERHAAVLNLHRHGGGPRVNGVLHQLFHHRGRPLHHLPGGNQVGYMGLQGLNMGHGCFTQLSLLDCSKPAPTLRLQSAGGSGR